MGWLDKLINIFKKDKKVQTEIIITRLPEEDSKPILKDKDGRNLICCLCDNTDNVTGLEYPIREGQKKVYGGKVWHLNCYRAFVKAIKKGDMI